MSFERCTVVAERHGADARVVVRGELDLATAMRLEGTLARLAKTGLVVLDLRDVTLVDSTGLRMVAIAVSELAPRVRIEPARVALRASV
jgi:anti-anti-sigma factor